MAMAARVNLARDELLTRAALALHEDREIRIGNAREPGAQLLHQRTLANEHRLPPSTNGLLKKPLPCAFWTFAFRLRFSAVCKSTYQHGCQFPTRIPSPTDAMVTARGG
jgi:hypothetical protein